MSARKKQPAKRTPKQPDKSYARKVCIDPPLAEKWLEKNTENRPCPGRAIARIARSIELNRFRVNGETIKFDTTGRLRDGQTRLRAVIAANRAVWCWVVFDLDPDFEVFETIDQGRLRKLGDLLGLRDYKNYTALASAARLVYNLDEDVVPEPGGFTAQAGVVLVEQSPGLVKSMDLIGTNAMREVYSLGLAAGLHYVMAKKDQQLADSFWQAIETGVIASQRSPMRIVRDTLVRNKAASPDQKLTPTTIQAIIIKGWNLMRTGKTRVRIQWSPDREAFPVIQ